MTAVRARKIEKVRKHLAVLYFMLPKGSAVRYRILVKAVINFRKFFFIFDFKIKKKSFLD